MTWQATSSTFHLVMRDRGTPLSGHFIIMIFLIFENVDVNNINDSLSRIIKQCPLYYYIFTL